MTREAYFTAQTLDAKSLEMLSELASFRQRHSGQVLHRERAALFVLDMQSYFLSADSHAFVPSAPALLPGVQSLINAFYRARRPVILTRHVNAPEDAGRMGQWWKDMIPADSPTSEIVKDLDASKGMIFDKHQYDAFWGTALDETLRSRGVGQVAITGVMTHLCCETTARSAFMRGYEVFFAIDGTATYTEAFHRAALLNLAHGFAVPVLVNEVLDACRD